MIDIHSHILYDIPGDDGAGIVPCPWTCCARRRRRGPGNFSPPPHFHRRGICPSWDVITERLAQLQQAADDTGIPIRLHSGAEVSLDADTLNYLRPGTAGRTAWRAPPISWWNCCPRQPLWKPGTCCISSSSGVTCHPGPPGTIPAHYVPSRCRPPVGGKGHPAPEQQRQLSGGLRRNHPAQRPLALRSGRRPFPGQRRHRTNWRSPIPGRPMPPLRPCRAGKNSWGTAMPMAVCCSRAGCSIPIRPTNPQRKNGDSGPGFLAESPFRRIFTHQFLYNKTNGKLPLPGRSILWKKSTKYAEKTSDGDENSPDFPFCQVFVADSPFFAILLYISLYECI